jgi:type IV secretory pathway VirB2 component (pilin)
MYFKTWLKCLGFVLPWLPRVAVADTMPWDNSLTAIQQALTGTTAHVIIVIAIAMAGLAFAVGEQGSLFRKGAAIIFGGSIATGAASLYAALKFSGSGW